MVLNRKFSSWEDVLSSILQGSMLGPLLFEIFINDTDKAVTQVEIIKKFKYDIKIGQKMLTKEDIEAMQSALDNLHI